jgi:hypothetical protein
MNIECASNLLCHCLARSMVPTARVPSGSSTPTLSGKRVKQGAATITSMIIHEALSYNLRKLIAQPLLLVSQLSALRPLVFFIVYYCPFAGLAAVEVV